MFIFAADGAGGVGEGDFDVVVIFRGGGGVGGLGAGCSLAREEGFESVVGHVGIGCESGEVRDVRDDNV